MKAPGRKARSLTFIALLLLFCPVIAHGESAPQDLRAQACHGVFQIVAQCQVSAQTTTKSCTEISGILTSPETKGALKQQKPGDATDVLVEKTLAQVVDMCSNACYRARAGKSYKTAQEWMDGGGCTIQAAP